MAGKKFPTPFSECSQPFAKLLPRLIHTMNIFLLFADSYAFKREK